MVGGDLYDITMTQYGPRFIIGDVKGKGLDAVGLCAAVLAVFRELAFAEPDLVKLAEQMDTRLSRDMEIEDFVTIILAEFAGQRSRPGHVGDVLLHVQVAAAERPQPRPVVVRQGRLGISLTSISRPSSWFAMTPIMAGVNGVPRPRGRPGRSRKRSLPPAYGPAVRACRASG
jgi:hypothetical protein